MISEASDTLSEAFDAHVGAEHAAVARLAVYLHALQDRISHHRCIDIATLTGPFAGGITWFEDLDNPNCNQIVHLSRHAWETGVDQRSLNVEDQTTTAALRASYDELLKWATVQGAQSATAADPARREEVLRVLGDALAVRHGDRVRALIEAGCDLGYEPLPGHGDCS